MSSSKFQMTSVKGRRPALQSGWLYPILVIFVIVAVYVVIGTLYAVKTPAWQVPDEPAHYNYVRFVAEGRGLPVLEPGDYDGVFLENVKAARFPSSIPIDSIRY